MNSSKDTKRVANNIKTIREQKGLTQEDIAKKIPMNTNYFAVYERGEREIPSIRLVKIAKALNVDVSELTKGIK